MHNATISIFIAVVLITTSWTFVYENSSIIADFDPRGVQIRYARNSLLSKGLFAARPKVFSDFGRFSYRAETMKQKLWLPVIICLAYCIDKELYKAID